MSANRNVFLFGAGTSAAAGIPLLNGFVDQMVEIALRGKVADKQLSQHDLEIFGRVKEIRDHLDAYHGRAHFDDRNIEDLLSILALAANSGGRREKKYLSDLTRAIARTIDLVCSTPKAAYDRLKQEAGDASYRAFWRGIVTNAVVGGHAPTIISLNYDLVLERSLVQTLVSDHWNRYDNPFPYGSVRVNYHCSTVPDKILYMRPATFGQFSDSRREGYAVSDSPIDSNPQLVITILKLHGSLNFPRKSGQSFDWQQSADEPLIVPPMFNKSAERSLAGVWETSLSALRDAVNLVICGYSLPKTDAYMQYFLKAALGPNTDLSSIAVFDPALHRNDVRAGEMRARFGEVFSEQIRGRIDFSPVYGAKNDSAGTFAALVHALSNNHRQLLFI